MAHHAPTVNALDAAQADPHQHQEHAEHGGPKLYFLILLCLLCLTVITVIAAGINFGSGMTNVIIAMGIASLKASLVALFFMHLRWDKPMNAIIFCTSLFFLSLFLIASYGDNISRPPSEPTKYAPPSGVPVVPKGNTPQPELPGHGTPGAMSPSGGGPAIPGASAEGSHGGAAKGTNVVAPH